MCIGVMTMKLLKKVVGIVLLLSNLLMLSQDTYKHSSRKKNQKDEVESVNNSTALWAGIGGFVGAVAGVAVGSWLMQGQDEVLSNSTVVLIEPLKPKEEPVLSYKGRRVQEKLNQLSKYGNSFELRNDFQSLTINLYKIGFRLDDIDSNFFSLLAQDHKVLHDAGYSIWWNSFTSLEEQKSLYLANCKALISYFNRNRKFIESCQIVNLYDRLPEYFTNLSCWIRLQCHISQEYPLIFYAEQVQSDMNKLMSMKQSFCNFHQPFVDRLQKTYKKLENLLRVLYSSADYRNEINQKRQQKLLEELHRLEEEKLKIACKQAEALEEPNRLAAERNRIEQKRDQWYCGK